MFVLPLVCLLWRDVQISNFKSKISQIGKHVIQWDGNSFSAELGSCSCFFPVRQDEPELFLASRGSAACTVLAMSPAEGPGA